LITKQKASAESTARHGGNAQNLNTRILLNIFLFIKIISSKLFQHLSGVP
jgi:hypothetical protein